MLTSNFKTHFPAPTPLRTQKRVRESKRKERDKWWQWTKIRIWE